MKKIFLVVALVIVSAPFIYNIDAYRGQRKLAQLCKDEGGTRIDRLLEKNVGWYVADTPDRSHSYISVLGFEHVAFVRWKNGKGEIFDVVKNLDYRGPTYGKYSANAYHFKPADLTKKVRYEHKLTLGKMAGDDRFRRRQEQILNADSGVPAATFTDYLYQWTSPERVILNAPTIANCSFKYSDYRNFSKSLFVSESK